MSVLVRTEATPLGPWTVVVDEAGVVLASGFSGEPDTLGRLARSDAALDVRPLSAQEPVAQAMRAYLSGDVTALDDVPTSQPGGAYQREVWRVMRQIPAGVTWSYTELATKAGRPAATRAAATACARNRVAPFVPCHRVVRFDGTLGGYYYGLPVKRWLLEHERGAAP